MKLLRVMLGIGFLWVGGCGDGVSPDKARRESVAALSEELREGQQIYFGNLHAHTKLSDGKGTPAEGFAWARDQARYDFYAITDHAKSLTALEWSELGKQAAAFTKDGSFVALRGFEWSHSLQGHANVYNTGSYVSALSKSRLSDFYNWLDEQGGIAQLNHPGRESGVFDHLAFQERVGDNIAAIETGNKDTGNAEGAYLTYYGTALDQGFRVAPTNNQDNHSLKGNPHRTAILAGALTQGALLEALVSRRVYSTDDPNLRLLFKLGEAWMGEEVRAVGPTAVFDVLVEDDEPIERIEIIGRQGKVVAQQAYPRRTLSAAFQPVVPVEAGEYFYVKVTERNELDPGGDLQIAVSAPIWIRGGGSEVN